MKTAIRSGKELLLAVGLDESSVPLAAAESDFPVFVPKPWLDRIEKGNPDDPLLRQVLPVKKEDEATKGFSTDPICESDAVLGEGVLQKYQGRVLVIATGACAIHCRYCFRRFFPYDMAPGGDDGWLQSIRQIATDADVHEIILSGGDPLTLSNEKLSFILDEAARIPHIKRIRVHSRLPVVIPQRVNDGLTELLKATATRHNVQVIFVIHTNHPREIDDAVRESLTRLKDAASQLLNQTVLLAGVNDNTESLVALSERLLAAGVLPYYLHQLDRVQGTAHFEVSVDRGKRLIEEMRASLPGYGVPRFVQEIPDRPGKTVLA